MFFCGNRSPAKQKKEEGILLFLSYYCPVFVQTFLDNYLLICLEKKVLHPMIKERMGGEGPINIGKTLVTKKTVILCELGTNTQGRNKYWGCFFKKNALSVIQFFTSPPRSLNSDAVAKKHQLFPTSGFICRSEFLIWSNNRTNILRPQRLKLLSSSNLVLHETHLGQLNGCVTHSVTGRNTPSTVHERAHTNSWCLCSSQSSHFWSTGGDQRSWKTQHLLSDGGV